MPRQDLDSPERASLLQRYLERALEIQERGETVGVDALCQAHPELAAPLRDALDQQLQLWDWADDGLEDPLAGQTFAGRYRLTRRLGAGAMGAVYRAEDLELRRGVAVKVLQPYLFGDPGVAQRFQREAEALAKLRHPHVVAVFDRGTTEQDHQFLVMELLDGAPLSDILDHLANRDPATVRDSAWLRDAFGITPTEQSWVRQGVRWARELATGLSAAHAAGVFHRDVKPSNVFVTRDGRALLLDFGIAAHEDDATLTRGDTTLGTPKDMAPEQAAKSVAPNPQLDVYSLAATLYHLLAGRAPYEGDARTVIAALQREEPPALRALHRGLFPDLVAVVEAGMARDLAQRYPSAQALQGDLEAFLEHRSVSARYRGPVARAWRRARRSTWLRLSAAGLAVALSAQAAGAWLDYRRGAQQELHDQVWVPLPPALTLSRDPVIQNLAERSATRARLEQLAATAPDSGVSRAFLIGFLVDHGDLRAAASQAADFARRASDPYLDAAAARYGSATRSRQVDLSDLPAPTTTQGRSLAGYHALRRRDFTSARALLSVDSDDAETRELALDAAYGCALREGEEALGDVYRQALEIAGKRLGHTARTLHIAVLALAKRGRYEEALPLLRRLVSLLPDDYGARLNLGTTLRRLDQPAAAIVEIERALRLRPGEPKAVAELAKSLAYLGRYDEAQRQLRRARTDHPDAWYSAEAASAVEMIRSLDWRVPPSERLDAAAAGIPHAEQAAQLLRAARRSGTAPPNFRELLTTVRANAAMLGALVEGDVEFAKTVLFGLLQRDPTNIRLLMSLRDLIHDDPNSDALHHWLDALAVQLSVRRGRATKDYPGLKARD